MPVFGEYSLVPDCFFSMASNFEEVLKNKHEPGKKDQEDYATGLKVWHPPKMKEFNTLLLIFNYR